MHKFLHQKALIIGLAEIILLMFPYFFLGADAFITIHDFLDSNPVHMKTIISLGLIGDPDGIIPVLNGVPSMSYVSLIPLDVKTILYMILPLFWAIVIHVFFVKVVAFIGMYMLCVKYVVKDNSYISLLTSFLFCLVPFYSDYALSAAGVPLFLYAFLNLEQKQHLLLSFVIIAFFTCNSSISLIGLFICLLWLIWIIYKWKSEHKIPKYHIFGILVMGLLYLFVNISILYNYFFPTGMVSHRVEFGSSGTLINSFNEFFKLIILSQYHAGSFLAVIIIGISFIIFTKYGKEDRQVKLLFYSYLILIGLILIGILVRFIPAKIFSSFQFDRFYFFYPALCFIILAKAMSLISQNKAIVLFLSCFVAGGVLIFDKELRTNVALICGITLERSPSYRQFFDDELFSQIKSKCNSSDDFRCKVVSVGMHPSIAEYHGFYTLDSYIYSYSLEYHHKFRKIIEKELEKNRGLRDYFDKWGSRCYVFSQELYENGNQYLCGKNNSLVVKHLDIDINTLREFGCQYLLSTVIIKNYNNLGLKYLGDYTTPNSYWSIKLYSL